MDSLHLIRLPCNKNFSTYYTFFSSNLPILFSAVVIHQFLFSMTVLSFAGLLAEVHLQKVHAFTFF